MSLELFDYHRRREQQERKAADRSSCGDAAARHREMAELHAERAMRLQPARATVG